MLYLYTTLGSTKYATTEEAAKHLERWTVCSGGVYKYDLGYRCDGYAPNAFFWAIIILGIASFMCGVFAFLFELRRKSK